jgi:beta-phosphoglucomutase-like phosphatase (HAD superfamily)
MAAELERLRPMEASLELAEANRDAYKKRVEELTAEHHKERDEYIDWVNRLQKENAEFKAMVATDNSEVIARLEAENMKLKSCIKCLVMRDLIKDCPEKNSVIEIVKEYK